MLLAVLFRFYLLFAKFFEFFVQKCVIWFLALCVIFKVKLLIYSNNQFVKAIERPVLTITNKRDFKFFCDETNTLLINFHGDIPLNFVSAFVVPIL